jgi:hypothetical protein
MFKPAFCPMLRYDGHCQNEQALSSAMKMRLENVTRIIDLTFAERSRIAEGNVIMIIRNPQQSATDTDTRRLTNEQFR